MTPKTENVDGNINLMDKLYHTSEETSSFSVA